MGNINIPILYPYDAKWVYFGPTNLLGSIYIACYISVYVTHIIGSVRIIEHMESWQIRWPLAMHPLLGENALACLQPRKKVSAMSIRIAYLGPEGTYCHEAAYRFANRMDIPDATFTACSSFMHVFDAVEGGVAEYGVVALENSIEGPVTATLDAFATRTEAVMLGEEVVDICHCLVVNPRANLDDVKTIASHPQALAQCRKYLMQRFPNAQTVTAPSTAEAAKMAADDPAIAAIANEHAAKLAGLAIVDKGIEDHRDDQTNFALIARTGHSPVFQNEGAMKTSLALYLYNDRPGALQMILSEFAYGGINLTKIQSRPTKRKLGEYMFFIDIEGSTEDEAVKTALDCLRLKLRLVKVLGCYPAAYRRESSR